MTAADVLRQNPPGRRKANWGVANCCSAFLKETSERDDFWGKARASPDSANGLSRVSLAGLDMEKKRCE